MRHKIYQNNNKSESLVCNESKPLAFAGQVLHESFFEYLLPLWGNEGRDALGQLVQSGLPEDGRRPLLPLLQRFVEVGGLFVARVIGITFLEGMRLVIINVP